MNLDFEILKGDCIIQVRNANHFAKKMLVFIEFSVYEIVCWKNMKEST